MYGVGRASIEIQDGILKIEDGVLGLWAARLDFTDSARVPVIKENITSGCIESSGGDLGIAFGFDAEGLRRRSGSGEASKGEGGRDDSKELHYEWWYYSPQMQGYL